MRFDSAIPPSDWGRDPGNHDIVCTFGDRFQMHAQGARTASRLDRKSIRAGQAWRSHQ